MRTHSCRAVTGRAGSHQVADPERERAQINMIRNLTVAYFGIVKKTVPPQNLSPAVGCALWAVRCALWAVRCALCAVCAVRCALWAVRCALPQRQCCVMCSLCAVCALCVLRPCLCPCPCPCLRFCPAPLPLLPPARKCPHSRWLRDRGMQIADAVPKAIKYFLIDQLSTTMQVPAMAAQLHVPCRYLNVTAS